MKDFQENDAEICVEMDRDHARRIASANARIETENLAAALCLMARMCVGLQTTTVGPGAAPPQDLAADVIHSSGNGTGEEAKADRVAGRCGRGVEVHPLLASACGRHCGTCSTSARSAWRSCRISPSTVFYGEAVFPAAGYRRWLWRRGKCAGGGGPYELKEMRSRRRWCWGTRAHGADDREARANRGYPRDSEAPEGAREAGSCISAVRYGVRNRRRRSD